MSEEGRYLRVEDGLLDSRSELNQHKYLDLQMLLSEVQEITVKDQSNLKKSTRNDTRDNKNGY